MMIKVLIIDDSAMVRQCFRAILSADPEIEVVGAAPDPYVAREFIAKEKPDVLTLDVEMPRMDGLTFLQHLMKSFPIPTVIVSSLTTKGCDTTLKAFDIGAVDVIQKPAAAYSVREMEVDLVSAVKAAAKSKVQKRDQITRGVRLQKLAETTNKVLAIGASTGGTNALEVVLSQLPANGPGTVVVQHMPEKFTASFANRLNDCCAMEVLEGQPGMTVIPGRIIIAPGNHHMRVARHGGRYEIEISQEDRISGHRPSVDVLFRSVARHVGANAIGIILTGMGRDGADGMLEMKLAGALTAAQDEQTCIVFGMPKEALANGAADKAIPLPRMAAHAMRLVQQISVDTLA